MDGVLTISIDPLVSFLLFFGTLRTFYNVRDVSSRAPVAGARRDFVVTRHAVRPQIVQSRGRSPPPSSFLNFCFMFTGGVWLWGGMVGVVSGGSGEGVIFNFGDFFFDFSPLLEGRRRFFFLLFCVIWGGSEGATLRDMARNTRRSAAGWPSRKPRESNRGSALKSNVQWGPTDARHAYFYSVGELSVRASE